MYIRMYTYIYVCVNSCIYVHVDITLLLLLAPTTDITHVYIHFRECVVSLLKRAPQMLT